jgi:hypothetical protein
VRKEPEPYQTRRCINLLVRQSRNECLGHVGISPNTAGSTGRIPRAQSASLNNISFWGAKLKRVCLGRKPSAAKGHPAAFVNRHQCREGGAVLLLGPPRAPGFRFCYPVRSEPCSRLCKFRPLGRHITQREQVLRCRWHLWFLSLMRVTQPGQKLRFSTHVDPGSAPSGVAARHS